MSEKEGGREGVCVRERETESESVLTLGDHRKHRPPQRYRHQPVCVCACVRERVCVCERESVCARERVCVCVRERQCVCAWVCE